MKRLLVCNNVFDAPEAEGRSTEVGEVIAARDEGRAERLLSTRLCDPLSPAWDDVDAGPGETLLHHKGGGWYAVADAEGVLLQGDNPVQGKEAAQRKAKRRAQQRDQNDDS